MKLVSSSMFRLFGLLVASCFLLAIPGVSLAQEATPTGADAPHPVHIHEGTCTELNPAPQFPLTDITAPTNVEGTEIASAGSPIAVETSTTTIDATLADIANGDHAINVHESVENIGNYIACGDIGGAVLAGANGNEITIGLHEMNGSGHAGIAVLQEAGEQLNVTIYLAQGLSGDATATPDAGASHGDMDMNMAGDVQVDIANFAYNPETITISAGQSITWTNQDSTPHTVTGKDRDFLQSGTMNQGDSFTQTFDEPGTYEYFCEFHPNMMGIVVVE